MRERIIFLFADYMTPEILIFSAECTICGG